jgi:hypothetical protein
MTLRPLYTAGLAALIATGLVGCVSINVPPSTHSEDHAASTPIAQPTEDVSGALTALSYAIGALAKSSGPAPTAEDCSYTTYVIGVLANATPAEQWRGTYETITSNMRTIAALCAADPASADAANLARLTRPNVATILNEEQWNGQTTWG